MPPSINGWTIPPFVWKLHVSFEIAYHQRDENTFVHLHNPHVAYCQPAAVRTGYVRYVTGEGGWYCFYKKYGTLMVRKIALMMIGGIFLSTLTFLGGCFGVVDGQHCCPPSTTNATWCLMVSSFISALLSCCLQLLCSISHRLSSYANLSLLFYLL